MVSQRFIRSIVYVSVSMLAVLAGIFMVSTLTKTWDVLHFNPFALLSMAAIISNVVLLVLINRQKRKAPETFWFSLFLLEIIYWATCEMMQRLSSTPEAAISWYSISSPGWVLLGVTYWIYTLQVTDNMRFIRTLPGILAVIAAPLSFLLLALKTPWLINYDIQSVIANPWGFYSAYGPLFNYFLIWLEVFFIASLIMMFRRYRSTEDPRVKRQALTTSIALAIPLAVGSFTDGIFPAFDINVIPLAVTLTSIQAAITGYAIIKYHIFTFNTKMVASNILAGMNEVVLILNRNHRIEYINERTSNILGYPMSTLLGAKIETLFTDDRQMKDFKNIALSPSADTKFQNTNVDIKTVTGGHKSMLASSAQVVDPDTGEPAYILVMTDLSQVQRVVLENKNLADTKLAMINALEDARLLEEELKNEKANVEKKVVERTHQLAEEQARLNASINSLQVGFMIINGQKKLQSINAASYAILETKPSKSFDFAEVASRLSTTIDLESQIQQVVITKKPVTLKDLMWRGKYLRIFISPVITEKKEVIGTVILLQDITEEKILQRSREEFFSIASHELRTPLTAIRGNTSMLQGYFGEILEKNPDMKEMINDIHGSSVRLITIVNDFLDATRLEQGGMKFTDVDVDTGKLAAIVIQDLQSVAQEKNIYIKNEIGSRM
ncbi:MAG TPA: histidine kinase N-terminal 7TM domain-containing protein, partial [Candidatus Saccharimonadia bacterium]